MIQHTATLMHLWHLLGLHNHLYIASFAVSLKGFFFPLHHLILSVIKKGEARKLYFCFRKMWWYLPALISIIRHN